MMTALPQVLVATGEPSGDLAAARVIRTIQMNRRCDVYGIGGSALEAAGVRLVDRIDRLSAIGIGAAVGRLGGWVHAWARLRAEAVDNPPDAALLVDAPEVNLPLAGALKRAGTKVVYFIGPQVWAWRSGRLGLLRERTDVVALILPFEKAIYDEAGVRSCFVGHPILDNGPALSAQTVRAGLDLKPEKPVVALLPGSRPGEVKRLGPPLIEAGEHLVARGIEAVFAPPAGVRFGRLVSAARRARLKLTPETMTVRDLLQVTDAAVVASGTATLEAAVAGIPMAVVYRLDRLSFAAGKLVFQIPFVALPNWIAGRKVVPELLQDEVVPPLIFNHAVRLLSTVERERQRAELKAVAESLGTPGVSARVAYLVLERLP